MPKKTDCFYLLVVLQKQKLLLLHSHQNQQLVDRFWSMSMFAIKESSVQQMQWD